MPIDLNGPPIIDLAPQPSFFAPTGERGDFNLRVSPGAERIDFLDCYFLIDTTGSMEKAIANVGESLITVMFAIPKLYQKIVQGDFPDIFYGMGWYKDFEESPACFSNVLPLTRFDQLNVNLNIFHNAVVTLVSSLGGGGDAPECQLFALNQLATQPGIGWRPETLGFFGRRIIVWTGDAPGHDPSGGVTPLEVIFNCNAIKISVNALSVEGNGLNNSPL
jgi:hypothetical protein